MKPAPSTRTLTAWLLYASVLFSLFACGLHHGQMSGLELSGLDGGYCSLVFICYSIVVLRESQCGAGENRSQNKNDFFHGIMLYYC